MTRRVALVTGANRGLGEVVARDLALAGLEVLAACRTGDDAEATARALTAEGFHARPVHVDLADRASVARCARWLAGERVDVLVNNAGVYPGGTLEAVDEAVLRDAFEVHVFGPLALCRAVLPGMRARRWGRVVNVSSGYGSFAEGLEGPGAYSVSKAALNALTFKLARELPDSIKVNAVCPGWVRTRMGGAGADRAPEDAGRDVARLALLPDDGPTGRFFREERVIAW